MNGEQPRRSGESRGPENRPQPLLHAKQPLVYSSTIAVCCFGNLVFGEEQPRIRGEKAARPASVCPSARNNPAGAGKRPVARGSIIWIAEQPRRSGESCGPGTNPQLVLHPEQPLVYRNNPACAGKAAGSGNEPVPVNYTPSSQRFTATAERSVASASCSLVIPDHTAVTAAFPRSSSSSSILVRRRLI